VHFGETVTAKRDPNLQKFTCPIRFKNGEHLKNKRVFTANKNSIDKQHLGKNNKLAREAQTKSAKEISAVVGLLFCGLAEF
jgi:hypothetical protein